MLVKGGFPLSVLREIASTVRADLRADRVYDALEQVEIATLLFKHHSAQLVWSSSLGSTVLKRINREFHRREEGLVFPRVCICRPGQALGIAAGAAFRSGVNANDNRVYCCLSGSDLLGGGVWEAAILAVKLHLGALAVFVIEEANGTGLLADKYAACGWNVHLMNTADITEGFTLLSALDSFETPSVVIARAAAVQPVKESINSNGAEPGKTLSAEPLFIEIMAGLSRGIEAVPVPDVLSKAVFVVKDRREPLCFQELDWKTRGVRYVDCGPAEGGAFSLAKGFRRAGGVSFVAIQRRKYFELAGIPDPGHSFSRTWHIIVPRSGQEAEKAVLRLWRIDESWRIRLFMD